MARRASISFDKALSAPYLRILFLLIALAGVAFATLIPAGTQTFAFSYCLYCGSRATADLLANLVLFAPVGAALTLGGLHPYTAVLAGAATSFAVEVAQLWIPGRDPGVSDLISNTAGTAAGVVLAAWQSWANSTESWRDRLVLLAGAFGCVVLFATGYLLVPSTPLTPFFGQWTPYFASMEQYSGRVLDVSVGDVRVPPDELVNPTRLAEELNRNAPIALDLIAGREPKRLSPIFSVADDRGRRIVLVGAIRRDVVFSQRLRAADWRLDRPNLRIAEVFGDVQEGDRISLRFSREGSDYCVAVAGTERCGFGFGPGSGWELIVDATIVPPVWRNWLHFLWLAMLATPLGFWSGRSGPTIGSLLLFGLTLATVPGLTDLRPASIHEWGGAAAGVGAGALIALSLAQFRKHCLTVASRASHPYATRP